MTGPGGSRPRVPITSQSPAAEARAQPSSAHAPIGPGGNECMTALQPIEPAPVTPVAVRPVSRREKTADATTAWRVVCVILGYFAVVFVLKAVLFTGASPDEGEQLLHAQDLRLGYHLENPPLFTWLVALLSQLTGPSLGLVTAVRLGALCAYYLGLWVAARQVLRDPWLAAATAVAPLTLWFTGWDALRNYTHSLLLVACITWLFATLLAWRRTRGRDLAFGAAVGVLLALGTLSKYSFLLPATTLLGGALFCDRRLRARLCGRGGALAAVLATVLLAPHLLWLAAQAGHFTRTVTHVLQGPSTPDHASPGALTGLGTLLETGFEYSLPFTLLFSVVFGFSLLGRRGAVSAARLPARRWLDFHLGALALALVAGALAMRTAGVSQHHHFVFALLPLWAFAQLPRQLPRVSRRAWFAIVAGFALASLVALPWRAVTEAADCGKCHDIMPYRAFAAQLRALGFDAGPIISFSNDFSETGENLRRFFPAARVFSTKHPQLTFTLAGVAGAHCLVVWNATLEPARAETLLTEVPPLMTMPVPSSARRGVLTAPLAHSARLAPSLGYALLARGEGGCPRAESSAALRPASFAPVH